MINCVRRCSPLAACWLSNYPNAPAPWPLPGHSIHAVQTRDNKQTHYPLTRVNNARGPVCREELENYDAFDEGVFCRSRFWLFLSYVVSFASVIGAAWVLLQGYALSGDAPEVWPGVAGLFQVPQFCFTSFCTLLYRVLYCDCRIFVHFSVVLPLVRPPDDDD